MPHSKFWLVCCEIWVVKLLCFFFIFFLLQGVRGLRLFFLHTWKKCCYFLMSCLIALKFGTNKKHIKVNSGTEFGMNLISIQCVRSDELRRKWLTFRPAYKVNRWWNSLKIAVCIGELLYRCLLVVRSQRNFCYEVIELGVDCGV